MSDSTTSTQEVSQTPRILLVDDEPGLRTAVQAYLEDEGFQVTTAVDGEEGWEKARGMTPDITRVFKKEQWPNELWNDWTPNLEDYKIIRERIEERIKSKPNWYRRTKHVS